MDVKKKDHLRKPTKTRNPPAIPRPYVAKNPLFCTAVVPLRHAVNKIGMWAINLTNNTVCTFLRKTSKLRFNRPWRALVSAAARIFASNFAPRFLTHGSLTFNTNCVIISTQ